MTRYMYITTASDLIGLLKMIQSVSAFATNYHYYKSQ
jgi:hypothetical protein